MADKLLSVEVVSASHPVWSGEAEFVSAPTTEGSIGIYPKHQPLLSLLADGDVRVDLPGDSGAVVAHVTGGFISVDCDVVTVVADAGEIVGG
ncbi:MAG: F0F1 ATP synthase subunit epsilon [Bifidobacteriaceae bacterium]|nr:F0F1 ATP synthase subunit epsilon [Bifidobacteriaceae bacterium]